jgi:AcrR family transcriptional regulator
MSEKETAKQRMINVTIELICQGKKPSEITVADITEKAGVGNGMVNYHFQSKDNLMRTAVKRVTVCAKKSFPEKLEAFENVPAKERLPVILKEVSGFFAQNAEISKIAILDNLENEDGVPHLLSDMDVFNDCLKEIYGDDTHKIMIKSYIIAGFLNYIFLKSNIIKKETGFDFFNKQQRENAIDNFISDLFKCCEMQF